ncbi:MAG TPA: methyltransferase domain-containing protein [Streptosporangiales bacterium]
MTAPDPEDYVRELAAESLADGDPTGWFERLYAASATGAAVVPWDRGGPHPLVAGWAEERALDGAGRRAVVVGCGLGGDAEYVSARGYATTAFDVSASAVDAARRRSPDSAVDYLTADLLALPGSWRGGFDLVVETFTVQALPVELHARAIAAVAGLVAAGGTLLVVAAARDSFDDPAGAPPWPLLRAEVDSFATGTLRAVRVDAVTSSPSPRPTHWRAEFVRDG